VFLYDWQFTANQFVLATSPLRLMTTNFIFQLNTCGYSHYVTSSLTRGWVCSLQLLLVLASAVILRSASRGTHDYILLSQIRDSPNLEDQAPVFTSPRNRVAQLYPQAVGSVFSPPTTRRPTVELLDPASRRTAEKPPVQTVPLLLTYFPCVSISVYMSPSILVFNGVCTKSSYFQCWLFQVSLMYVN
jgi:hypothetical protein